jgi:hypothetical protein
MIMISEFELELDLVRASAEEDQKPNNQPQAEPILCPHCQRTASNGIKCKGICVAESDY